MDGWGGLRVVRCCWGPQIQSSLWKVSISMTEGVLKFPDPKFSMRSCDPQGWGQVEIQKSKVLHEKFQFREVGAFWGPQIKSKTLFELELRGNPSMALMWFFFQEWKFIYWLLRESIVTENNDRLLKLGTRQVHCISRISISAIACTNRLKLMFCILTLQSIASQQALKSLNMNRFPCKSLWITLCFQTTQL